MESHTMPTIPVARAPRADRVAIDLAMPRVAANVRVARRPRDPQPQPQA